MEFGYPQHLIEEAKNRTLYDGNQEQALAKALTNAPEWLKQKIIIFDGENVSKGIDEEDLSAFDELDENLFK